MVTPDDLSQPRAELQTSPEERHGLGAVSLTPAAAQRLTSIHRFEVEAVARQTKLGKERFTAQLPGVDPSLLSHLDDAGVARVGTEVHAGMVLVGRVTPTKRAQMSSSDLAIDGALGVDDNVRDTSILCSPEEGGLVVEARLVPPKKEEELARAEVVLRLERRLRIGDLLVSDPLERAVVAEISDQLPADMCWPQKSGHEGVRKLACAEEVLEARSIGPYSLVTQQPLGDKASVGGQSVDHNDLRALEERGADYIIHELLTVKSDDVEGRTRLYTDIVQGAPSCRPTLTESTRALQAELLGLCFEVDFSAIEPAIAFLDSARVRECSNGEVTKPETISYTTFECIPDGLMCQKVFGPVRDFQCQCGRYSSKREPGKVCESCGVEVTYSRERRYRLGHLELSAPVLHPYLFDTIVSITGMTADQLDQVLHHRARLDGGIAESLAETGAAAVRGELRAVDLTTLARGRGRPAELAQAMLASATKPEQLILDALPITPADLRPLVPLVGGRFATSDLNDLYRRVINRNTRLKRLLELGAPPQILINEQMQLQLDVEHLIQNGLQGRTLTSPECRALRSLHESVTSRFSQALKGKRVDYSGRGSVVPHRGLDRTSVLLSRTIARELFRPFVYELLERQGHVRILKVAKAMVNSHDARAELALDEVSRNHPVIIFPRPNEGARVAGLLIQLWDEPAIGLHPERIEELGVVPGQAVVVHLPIDPLARAEARELQRVMPRKPETSPLGWIGRAVQSQNIGTTLINAALHRELDPVADRLSRRLLGRHESNPRLPELPPDWTP